MWLCLLFVYLCVFECSAKFKHENIQDVAYPIVGIFEPEAYTQRLAFNESMRHANLGVAQTDSVEEDSNVKITDLRLEPFILNPNKTDSYSIWREVCSHDNIKPIAIFGPQNPISDGAIRDQCSLDNIPHIQATWQPLDPDEEEESSQQETAEEEESISEVAFKKISINFFPSTQELSYAYAMLLKYYRWENFAVLYEDDFGLLRVQKILAEHSDQYSIPVRRLDPRANNNKIFKELVKNQESRILIDCHADHIMQYIREAQELQMVNYYQHYILISMDASTLAKDLSALQSNITWLSITQFDQLKDAQHFLAPRVGKWIKTKNPTSPPVTDIKVEALMMNDIANHVLLALQNVKKLKTPYSSICQSEPWRYGAQLQNEILKAQSNGVSGNIEFDDRGRRVNYTLYVNAICMKKLETIGTWSSAQPDSIIETEKNGSNSDLNNQLNNKHFVIISSKAKPYFYEKVKCPEDDETCVEESADENYEGFAVDLIKAIFDILSQEHFNYTYSFSKDDSKKYGKYNKEKKKWDGLIGELLDKKADLAVSDLTITEERKKVVDFSVPFMTLGISILYKKERKVIPGMFSFLNPYTFDVWMHTATAYCVVSIVLFICSRISPADWENPQPCDKDPEELENIWNFKNCAWLTMGSIMTQGCDILPKAIGTRWVCGMWWFFAVIVCQTYIAQLSASMTSALENEPINSVEDLAKQNKILYGAVEGGSTFEFFRGSKDKMFRRMYESMMANPVVLVKSNDEGEKRVLNGNNKYAFFMESCTIEYKIKRNCDLKKVGENLDSKDYGIAMPANSPFRTHINMAILKLKESNELDEIYKKWWENKNDAKQCIETVDENDVQGDLEMENLIGAFVVLIVGLFFCLFITAAEFMNEVRNIVVRENVTHKEVFIKELKASLNFFQLQKPVLRNPNRASSIASDSTERRERLASAIDNFMDLEKEMQ